MPSTSTGKSSDKMDEMNKLINFFCKGQKTRNGE